ncbi:MAG: DUF4197 domain-containing protein [Pseudomonadales bacterium]
MLVGRCVRVQILLLGLFSSISLHTVAAEKSWLDLGGGMLDSLLGGKQETEVGPGGLSLEEVSAGLKEALRVGSERVVSQLGQADGFNADPAIHIPLPSQLERARDVLDRVGMAGMMDDLELRLNRAAEQATPKAKALFWDAIKTMSFEDAKRIYNGPDDAATQYLREKMNDPLTHELRPLIDKSLSDVGAVQAYDRVMGQYQSIPFVPDVKANLTDHTLQKGLDGIFFYLAKEEAAIRKDPVKRTTELLRKVFGG